MTAEPTAPIPAVAVEAAPADAGRPDAGRADVGPDVEAPAPRRHSMPRRLAQWLLLLAPAVAIAVAAWHFRNMLDDGFIYLRIIQNLLDGNGPVFNLGERVETYTSPLWVALVTLTAALTPFSLPFVSIALGVGCTTAAVALAAIGSARVMRRVAPDAWLLPVGMLVFVSVPAVWTLSTMGLETSLVFLWFAASFWLLVRWSEQPGLPWRARIALLVVGLGVLIRPELAVSSGVLILLVVVVRWRGSSWRARGADLVWAAAIPVAYEVFRMGYFGLLVSTTAIAKEGTMLRPSMGLRYLEDFLGPYWLMIPLAVLLLGAYLPLALALRAHRVQLATVGAFALSGLLECLGVVLIGGDYVHGRLLVPSFFAVLVPVAVVPVTRRFAATWIAVAWAVVCALALRHPQTLLPFIYRPGDQAISPAERGLTPQSEADDWYTGPGIYMRVGLLEPSPRLDVVPAEGTPLPTLVSGVIGLDSYYWGPQLAIWDYFGLATPLAAHMELVRRGHPGHEKPTPTPWIVASLTAPGTNLAQFEAMQAGRDEAAGVNGDFVIYGPLIPNTTGPELAAETAAARRALTCPTIAELVAAPRRPLTLGTFLSNIWHSPERTKLRIPPDPATAVQQFCD